jgi:hypothetical protein
MLSATFVTLSATFVMLSAVEARYLQGKCFDCAQYDMGLFGQVKSTEQLATPSH